MPYCAETGCPRQPNCVRDFMDKSNVLKFPSLGGVAYQCKKCLTPGAGSGDNFFIYDILGVFLVKFCWPINSNLTMYTMYSSTIIEEEAPWVPPSNKK
jgi:hypothetical protein